MCQIPKDGSCKTCKGLDGILSAFESENIVRWQDSCSAGGKGGHSFLLTNKDKVHDQLRPGNLQPVAIASEPREFLLIEFRDLGSGFGRCPFQRLFICSVFHCNMTSA